MRGELVGVWGDTWGAIWLPIAELGSEHNDIFCELYRAAVECGALRLSPTPEVLADAIDDPVQAMQLFQGLTSDDFKDEYGAARLVESAFDVFEELGGDALSNEYFLLLEAFIVKYSLRYDLRRPCALCPTLPGMFAGLLRELRQRTSHDAHLNELMSDFEEAIRDIRSDQSSRRIKTCIQKQFNLFEALAARCPDVTTNSLGRICDQLVSWPHAEVREAVKRLYKFASDYPGIRHAGTPANALRDVDVRDLLAVSVVLAGFTPYLAHEVDSASAYNGGTR